MAENETAAPREPDPLTQALPYVVPYAVFGLLTMAADYLPDWQSMLYIVKVFALAATLWHYRRAYTELRPRFGADSLVAVIMGVLVIVVWVGLDPYYPQSGEEWRQFGQGTRVFEHADKAEGAFDPYEPGQMIPPMVAIVFRIIGAVLLVPIFEELLIRGWLIRFLVRDRFLAVPMGTFTWLSFAGTLAFMGLTHHEWLAAVICSAAFNGLLYWRKDLFLCVLAHAAANLALAVWVLTNGAWAFW